MKRKMNFVSLFLALVIALAGFGPIKVNATEADAAMYFPGVPYYRYEDAAFDGFLDFLVDWDSPTFDFCYESGYSSFYEIVSEYFEEQNSYSFNEYMFERGMETDSDYVSLGDHYLYKFSYGRNDNSIGYYGTYEEIQNGRAQLSQIASAWRGLSEYQKTKNIYDWVCNNLSYDYSLTNRSIGDVLNGRQVVCDGYAQTFQILAEEAGLQSRLLLGYLDGGYHIWNAVNIGGRWYFVDTTCGD